MGFLRAGLGDGGAEGDGNEGDNGGFVEMAKFSVFGFMRLGRWMRMAISWCGSWMS